MRATESTADYSRRFSGKAADYSKYRPGYPRSVVTTLKEQIGLDKTWTIADVGSGTGILSELFLRNGNKVLCVEPNPEMRGFATSRLARRFAGFVSVDGRAEATGLPSESADLVVVGQALHWFDLRRARSEFARVLREPKRVCVVYNLRKETGGAGRLYSRLVKTYSVESRRVPDLDETSMSEFFGRGAPAKFVVPNVQVLSLTGLLGRLASASYMPRRGTPRWATLEDEARRAARGRARQRFRLHYDTMIYLGTLEDREDGRGRKKALPAAAWQH